MSAVEPKSDLERLRVVKGEISPATQGVIAHARRVHEALRAAGIDVTAVEIRCSIRGAGDVLSGLFIDRRSLQ